MLKRLLFVAVLFAALPWAARADDFDYTYAEGSVISMNPSHESGSPSGPGMDGSLALAPNAHVFASYSHVSCCSISQNSFDIGAGWNTHLANQVDLLVDGEFLSVNTSGNSTDSGWGVTGGLRWWLLDRLEFDGYVNHTDINSNTENTLGARILWTFDSNWRVFAGASNNSDQNTYMIGARYDF
jgi:opacity protein-like surface antigen